MTRDEICNGLQEILGEAYSRWVNHQYTRDKLIIDIGTYVGEAIKLLKEQPDVVRCKDCEFWHDSLGCQLYSEGLKTPEDWFCADGERR